MIQCSMAVINQSYEQFYLLQLIPVVGSIVSVPTAFISGTMAIVNFAQALFKKIKDGVPFLRSEEEQRRDFTRSHLESTIDLSIIFANHVANICTVGVLNHIFVLFALMRVKS